MKRLIHLLFALIALSALAACGSDAGDGQEVATTETADTTQTEPQRRIGDRPDNVPAPIRSELTPTQIDTIRAMAARHNITRDEYWPTEGGVVGNDLFEVWYPRGKTGVSHALYLMDLATPARQKFADYFALVPDERAIVQLYAYMEDYQQATPRDWWHYSWIRGDTLTYQPLYILMRRGLDRIAVPHEYYKWALRQVTNNGMPRWFEEGIASYLSREEEILESQMLQFPDRNEPMDFVTVEMALDVEEDLKLTRMAYYRSYRMVSTLIDRFGDEKMQELVQTVANGRSMREACPEVFGMSYDALIDVATDYTMNVEKP